VSTKLFTIKDIEAAFRHGIVVGVSFADDTYGRTTDFMAVSEAKAEDFIENIGGGWLMVARYSGGAAWLEGSKDESSSLEPSIGAGGWIN
jgi:hypothetical protein